MHFLCKSLITSGLFFYKHYPLLSFFLPPSTKAVPLHRVRQWMSTESGGIQPPPGWSYGMVVKKKRGGCSPPRHLRRYQKTDECDKARNDPEYSWIQGCTQKNSQYSNTRMDCISARQRRNQLIGKDTKRLICDTCDSFYPIIYTYPHTGEVIEKNCHTVTCHNKTLNTLIINYYDTSNCLRAFVHPP